MFLQRFITSLILVPLVLCMIFYANTWVLGGVVFLILLLCSKESWLLIPLEKPVLKVSYLFFLLWLTWVCGYWFSYWLSAGLIFWLLVVVAILTFPASQALWGFPLMVAIGFSLLLPLFIQSLIHLYSLPQGKALFVYLLFLIWAADIGAYLAGKRWGQHKLIAQVSPGKSWEGLAGGFLLAMSVAWVGGVYFTPFSWVTWFFLAALTVMVSIFGDLFISILKRRCHLKDTGAIIPGHGGILDRLDSLMAASPLFYFGITALYVSGF